MWTDESPQWFAGGTFDFSADCRQTDSQDQMGNTVNINLENGSISRMDLFPEWFYFKEQKSTN